LAVFCCFLRAAAAAAAAEDDEEEVAAAVAGLDAVGVVVDDSGICRVEVGYIFTEGAATLVCVAPTPEAAVLVLPVPM